MAPERAIAVYDMSSTGALPYRPRLYPTARPHSLLVLQPPPTKFRPSPLSPLSGTHHLGSGTHERSGYRGLRRTAAGVHMCGREARGCCRNCTEGGSRKTNKLDRQAGHVVHRVPAEVAGGGWAHTMNMQCPDACAMTCMCRVAALTGVGLGTIGGTFLRLIEASTDVRSAEGLRRNPYSDIGRHEAGRSLAARPVSGHYHTGRAQCM